MYLLYTRESWILSCDPIWFLYVFCVLLSFFFFLITKEHLFVFYQDFYLEDVTKLRLHSPPQFEGGLV